MEIKDYYHGFSDDQIEQYRKEVRQRWGDETLRESDARVLKMGKDAFDRLQAEADAMFRTISLNMARGYDSEVVQEQVEVARVAGELPPLHRRGRAGAGTGLQPGPAIQGILPKIR